VAEHYREMQSHPEATFQSQIIFMMGYCIDKVRKRPNGLMTLKESIDLMEEAYKAFQEHFAKWKEQIRLQAGLEKLDD